MVGLQGKLPWVCSEKKDGLLERHYSLTGVSVQEGQCIQPSHAYHCCLDVLQCVSQLPHQVRQPV